MDLGERAVFFVCLISAIILHEISHGLVALRFGDDTAKRAGRLTLNPVPHIDPFGSLILPAMLAFTGFPAFGWAKPVPITPSRLGNPRRDMLLVGLAGPGSNFVLMGLSAIAARAVSRGSASYAWTTWGDLPLLVQVLIAFALVNLLLGLFNLLPIPPLDGSSLLERVLPGRWLPRWYQVRPYGMLVLFLLAFSTNLLGRFFAPFEEALFRFILG